MNRDLAFKNILCLGFIANTIITLPLWTTSRIYPTSPVFSWLPELTAPWDHGIVFCVLALLVVSILLRSPKYPLLFAIIGCGYLALEDQSRWHPWFYWYSFMLLSMLGYYSTKSQHKQDCYVNACRMILISSYIWAGLQKINVTFFFSLFPWVLSAWIDSPSDSAFWSKLPFIIPILELTIGLLLIVPSLRNLGVVFAVSMHVIIIVFIGPFGHNVNFNIWAWNLVLTFMVIILFYNRKDITPKALLMSKTLTQLIILVLFLIMPVLTFFNKWDAYPGFSLYSGSQRAGYIQFEEGTEKQIPEKLKSYLDDEKVLVAATWSMGENRTPDYAEPRIYKNLFKYVCEYINHSKEHVKIVIMSKPNRLNGKRKIDHQSNCAELENK